MKIMFTRRVKVKQGDGKGDVFEANSVHDLPEDSARHWLNRDVATDDEHQIAQAESLRASVQKKADHKDQPAKGRPDERNPATTGVKPGSEPNPPKGGNPDK